MSRQKTPLRIEHSVKGEIRGLIDGISQKISSGRQQGNCQVEGAKGKTQENFEHPAIWIFWNTKSNVSRILTEEVMLNYAYMQLGGCFCPGEVDAEQASLLKCLLHEALYRC